MNIIKLQKYWEDYKRYFELPKSEHQEKYKWGVLNQVYSKWNWNAEDIPEMFENAFKVEGKKNLWLSGNFFPIGHTSWMFSKFREETINEFNNLFNEQLKLEDRIKSFVSFYDLKLHELQKLVPDKKINYHSHRDYRAIALYLTLQYPEKYFLYKFTMFKNFSVKLELPKIKAGDYNNLINFIDLSNEVLDFIKKDSDFINTYKKFTSEAENYNDDNLHLLTQDFIYTIASHFNEGKKYWRIGSNDGNNSYYNQMLNENYIAIGWNEIGDLEEQEVEDRNKIQGLLTEAGYEFKDKKTCSRKAGEIYDFYSNAAINDVVTLMDGNSVLAIGKIITDYNFDDTKPFSHYREVEWLKKDIQNFNLTDGVQTTFYQLTKKETIDRILKELKNISSTNQSKNMSTPNKKYPLNQILYGAPGTGKTYITKKIAVEIIEGKEYTDRDTILKKYDELVKSNQVEFTTFHQSMSYEDFIEGIKPETIDNKITYEVKDGIFKQIADYANSKSETNNFEEVYNLFLKKISNDSDEYFELKTVTDKSFYLKVNQKNGLNLYTSVNKNKQGSIAKHKLLKQINGQKEFDGWEGYVNSVINHLEKNGLKTNKVTSEKKYVLIIDEINRGNVSSIFGELITLLEEDKRKGNKEEIEVILPYSQDKFSIPNNLYIIGTMNTADRSVESLDTALRRRFSFAEMQSNHEILSTEHITQGILKDSEGTEINLISILKNINERIELLIDKDHQIGHSFFIKAKTFEELKLVFKDNIIPLLEEYFFGDFGKIGLVLGGEFIKVKTNNVKFPSNFKYGEDDDLSSILDKVVYEFSPIKNWSAKTFISIYE